MSLSIQTNVASLDAQNAIRINTNFQNNTIEQLSSGYRINSSGDDAAGLAVANQYAGTIATLTQGVLNANNAVNTLQIADGGISNISTILNRLQTLATESASSTFAGNRTTVNNEYQGLLTEINRQASSINLNTGGTLQHEPRYLRRRRKHAGQFAGVGGSVRATTTPLTPPPWASRIPASRVAA